MLSYSENILQTITGKVSLQDVSIEQLQEIANTYPYFTAAQFFLSKKMFESKFEGYENALQKTALHYDNTLLLHFNLTEEPGINISDSLASEKILNITTETSVITNILEDDVEEVPAVEKNENLISVENFYDITENKKSLQINLKETNPETTNAESYNRDEEVSADETGELTGATFTEAAFESNEKLSNLLKEQAEAFEKPVEETALPIEIVPHHRIDYFESQGIKLDPEKEPDDKLGTQLKRFTDWLKQMKRISPNLNNVETDTAGETQVQNLAEFSNQSKEVLTETMAEVLIKQGKPEEAIHIYEKLSFSNPSKSTYFAAKIKELKP